MTAILAQVQGNGIRPRLLGCDGGLNGIGIWCMPRLTQCRHMIDVHTKQYRLLVFHFTVLYSLPCG
jgi:hypothetical protein